MNGIKVHLVGLSQADYLSTNFLTTPPRLKSYIGHWLQETEVLRLNK